MPGCEDSSDNLMLNSLWAILSFLPGEIDLSFSGDVVFL